MNDQPMSEDFYKEVPMCYKMKNSPIYDSEGCHGADDCCNYHPYRTCSNPECDYHPWTAHKCQGLKALIENS